RYPQIARYPQLGGSAGHRPRPSRHAALTTPASCEGEAVFDTNIVIVGNVLTAPEWRKTGSGHLVANFRVASTSRRLDRESGRWVDGNSLRVRVVCWRRLAEGVAASVTVGDPVVVAG